MSGKTLYDKLFEQHVVARLPSGASLLYIDRHMVHEVTSPIAFEAMRLNDREPWSIGQMLAVADHNTPTLGGDEAICDPFSKEQIVALRENANRYGFRFFDMGHPSNGVCHIVAPEQGFVLPGMTAVCGDSHTATYGALGVLSMGIGTTEVSHVLQTQTLVVKKLKNMQIVINGKLASHVTPKDVILYIIQQIGTKGGTGHAIEFSGEVFRSMSIPGRLTVSNMAIEAGAKVGLMKADSKTIMYCVNTPDFLALPEDQRSKASGHFTGCFSDPDSHFDSVHTFHADDIAPLTTWGTSPEQTVAVGGFVPKLDDLPDDKCGPAQEALKYMGLEPGTPVADIPVDYVFFGACTNGDLESLRTAAEVVRGRKKSASVEQVLVVPGSALVKAAAEEEGLDKVFTEAGFEWRNSGCSACLAMNGDCIPSGKHCASTSNRNFTGRQGPGSRTHLCSPLMAAVAAVKGRFLHPDAVL